MSEIYPVSRLEKQYVQLTLNTRSWIPGLISERISPRTYKVRTSWWNLHQQQKILRPKHIDSKQSLETAKRNTELVEHTPQYLRPKQMTKRHKD